MNLLKLLFRRKINAIHKSTRALPIYAEVPLAELKAQVEAEGWAYPSLPTRNHLWQKFKLWAWQRRQIKKSPRPLPRMVQVGAGHWREEPLELRTDSFREGVFSFTADSDYWKTHEPQLLDVDKGIDLVSGKRIDDLPMIRPDKIVTLPCGCTGMDGWRCPFCDAP